MPSQNHSDFDVALGILQDLAAAWDVRDDTGVEDAIYRARAFLLYLTLKNEEKSAKKG